MLPLAEFSLGVTDVGGSASYSWWSDFWDNLSAPCMGTIPHGETCLSTLILAFNTSEPEEQGSNIKVGWGEEGPTMRRGQSSLVSESLQQGHSDHYTASLGMLV